MVDQSGAISNQDAFRELMKWGAMIKNWRWFSVGSPRRSLKGKGGL